MIKRHRSIDPAHPGEILREDVLPALGMSKKSVAETLDISRQTLYDILNEKHPVTAEMAVRFGKLFGNGSQFWINLQRNNGPAHAERSVDISRIPTLGTRHAWTTAVRDCASLRTPKSQCVTMLWRRFVYSRLRGNRTTTGVAPTMMAGSGNEAY